jgi:hypothetical protein
LDEEEVVIETVLRRKWDTTGIALLGAGFGAVVQGSNEIHHNLIAPSGVQEPIASVLAQIALGTLAGTFLFTAVSVVHNLIGLKQGRSKPAVALPYHKGDFAFTGAILAIPLVLAHEIFNFLLGRWRVEFLESADPFSHIVWQIILAALGGELLFRAVAKIRRWGAASSVVD